MEINVLQLVTVGLCCINIWSRCSSYSAACSTHGQKREMHAAILAGNPKGNREFGRS